MFEYFDEYYQLDYVDVLFTVAEKMFEEYFDEYYQLDYVDVLFTV